MRLLPLLAAGLVLRLAVALLLPPGYDEAYYLFYGLHPALSYFDHPVGVGLWAWLGHQLPFGIVGLRMPSLLSYTGAAALLALASLRWFGTVAARWTVVLSAVSPLLLLVGGVLLFFLFVLTRNPVVNVIANSLQLAGEAVLLLGIFRFLGRPLPWWIVPVSVGLIIVFNTHYWMTGGNSDFLMMVYSLIAGLLPVPAVVPSR